MSRVCQICDRGPITTASRSHSNIQSKKISRVNLQVKTIDGKKTRICSSCIKKLSKDTK